MEGDMHKAAMAHYAHLSMDEKQKVLRLFEQTDANGDGQVTLDEYSTFFTIPSYEQSARIRVALIDLFKHLDKNNDGSVLRVVRLYGASISSVSNVTTYVDKENSYDLCCSCYHKKNFSHVHSYFLDTNALLRKIQCEDILAQDKMEEMREDIKEKMEEMGEVAMAYYAKLPDDQKQLVVSFYKRLDANGDGKVSIQEYSDFVKEIGLSRFLTPNMFKLLDKDDDGTLDFEECVTFFYMYKSHRLVFCDGCGSYILGIHFTCVECYNVGKGTYDLCCSCYHNNNFNNVHSFFLDNYALLGYLRNKKREKELEDVSRGIETGCRIAPVTQPAAVAHPAAAVKSHSRRKELEEGIRGFETGVRLFKIVHDAAVANPHAVHAVATNCTIM